MRFLPFLLSITIFLPAGLGLEVVGVRLPMYRIVLLLILLHLLITGRLFPAKDKYITYSMLTFSGLIFSSMIVNHDFIFALQPAGQFFLESYIVFITPIIFIKSYDRLKYYVSILVLMAIFQLFVSLPESVIETNWFRSVLGQAYGGFDTRLGLYRSMGSFDHPILYGAVCAALIGFSYFMFSKARLFLIFVASGLSLSSGAFASIVIQVLLIAWSKIFSNNKDKWKYLVLCVLALYISIEIFSNRSFWHVVLTRVTFSSWTAYGRIMQFEWGIENILANPYFGIGFNDWVRPEWKSYSLDNMWIVIAMKHGIPAFLAYLSCILICAVKVYKIKSTSSSVIAFRRAWLCGFVGILVSGATVHLWNNAFVFINLYFGIGYAFTSLEYQYTPTHNMTQNPSYNICRT